MFARSRSSRGNEFGSSPWSGRVHVPVPTHRTAPLSYRWSELRRRGGRAACGRRADGPPFQTHRKGLPRPRMLRKGPTWPRCIEVASSTGPVARLG